MNIEGVGDWPRWLRIAIAICTAEAANLSCLVEVEVALPEPEL
jgi:hypothetical protein